MSKNLSNNQYLDEILVNIDNTVIAEYNIPSEKLNIIISEVNKSINMQNLKIYFHENLQGMDPEKLNNEIGNLYKNIEDKINLKKIDFSNNNFNKVILAKTLSFLKVFYRLESIDFSFNELNKIDEKFLNSFLELCSDNEYLNSLSLRRLDFKPQNITKICNLILFNKSLKKIDLAFNDFSGNAQNLLETFKNNTNIEEIDLSSTNIGDGSMSLIIDIMKCNKNIKVLKIADNNFSEEKLIEFTKILQDNDSLTDLNFLNKMPSPKLFEALIKNLENNITLTSMPILFDESTASLKNSLNKIFVKNQTMEFLKKHSIQIQNHDYSDFQLDDRSIKVLALIREGKFTEPELSKFCEISKVDFNSFENYLHEYNSNYFVRDDLIDSLAFSEDDTDCSSITYYVPSNTPLAISTSVTPTGEIEYNENE